MEGMRPSTTCPGVGVAAGDVEERRCKYTSRLSCERVWQDSTPSGMGSAEQVSTSKGMLRTARRHPRRNLPSGLCGSMKPLASPAFTFSMSGPQQASHVLRRSSGDSISCTRCR